MRLFADDSFIFSPVTDVQVTHEQLVEDLETVSNWGYQWKMVFNPDITKQAVEVIFSVKKKETTSSQSNFQWYTSCPGGLYQTPRSTFRQQT